MLLAEHNGERVNAQKGIAASCPGCGAPVVAKCGDFQAHHWAHAAGTCRYVDKEESEWHLKWKSVFPRSDVEIKFGNHRADIFHQGRVIELQNSPLKGGDLWAREACYGDKLIWLLNGQTLGTGIETRKQYSESVLSFRWKWAPRTWAIAKNPIFLHNGKPGGIFHIEKIYWGACSGRNARLPRSLPLNRSCNEGGSRTCF